MPATLHRNFLHKLTVLLFFIEFNILICIMIGKQKTHLNSSSPAIQSPPQLHLQPVPRRRRKPSNPWVLPLIFQRQEKGCYSNLLGDIIHTEIPGYQDFVRMPPTYLTSTYTPPHQEVRHQCQEAIRKGQRLQGQMQRSKYFPQKSNFL